MLCSATSAKCPIPDVMSSDPIGRSVRVGQFAVGWENWPVTTNGGYLDLALVDVELFVSSGVPRYVFTVLPEIAWPSPTSPRFRVEHEALLALGWQRDALTGTPQPAAGHEPDLEMPHPYALGPSWTGSNCWRAEFKVGDLFVVGLVDHRWTVAHSGTCVLGSEMASDSPWRLHVIGLASGAVFDLNARKMAPLVRGRSPLVGLHRPAPAPAAAQAAGGEAPGTSR